MHPAVPTSPPASRLPRSARERWIRARTGLAHGGFEYAVTAAWSYAPWWLARYRHHVMLRCERGVRGPRFAGDASATLAVPGDAGRLAGHADLTREIVEQRLERGCVCVMVSENGRILATAWGAVGTRYLTGLGRSFRIPGDAFYIYETFTEPDARRRRLATLCYERLFERYASEGRRTAYAAVEVLNDASRTAHARWGFALVGSARKLDLPGVTIALCPRWPTRSRQLLLDDGREARRYSRA